MAGSSDDDPITEAVLSEDPVLERRYTRWSLLGTRPPAWKFRALGLLSSFTAVSLLAVVVLRRSTLRAVLGVDPLLASVAATAVLAAGLAFVTVGCLGLWSVCLLRSRRERSATAAVQLLGVEETVSLAGLVTGGAGVGVGLGLLVALAQADPAAPTPWIRDLADPLALPTTYGVVFAWATLLAVGCFVGSAYFETQGRRSGEE